MQDRHSMSPITREFRAACALGVFVALAACDHSSAPVSTTTTTSVARLPNGTAMDEIARARCARETACNNVGEKRTWETLDACEREQRDIARQAVSAQRCPSGIDASALPDCVEAIQYEACGASDLPSACLKTYLCL